MYTDFGSMYRFLYVCISTCIHTYTYIYICIGADEFLVNGITLWFSSPDSGAQRLVTSPRHHDLLNAITYLMCSMLKEDVQTCDDALCMHWPGLQMVSAG